MPTLFVNLAFGQPSSNSKYGSPFTHVQYLYCKDCIKSYTDEGTSSNEISKENFNAICCRKCGKPLNAEDNNDIKAEDKNDVKDDVRDATDDVKDESQKNEVKDDVKDESKKSDVKDDVKDGVWSYWAHNCFVIRKNKEPFIKSGDSGAILFDNKGLAWGLVFGTFTHPLKNTDYCLASPLCVALKALEQEFDIKGLKLW